MKTRTPGGVSQRIVAAMRGVGEGTFVGLKVKAADRLFDALNAHIVDASCGDPDLCGICRLNTDGVLNALSRALDDAEVAEVTE